MTVDTQKLALQALAGHGHVNPRPDGVKARCGGPAICRVCQQEKAQLEMGQKMMQAFHPLDGLHFNQGSLGAAADAYEREYLRDLIDRTLGRAYGLGQTYWQQADSEYSSQHRKADETQAKFDSMRAETVAKVSSLLDENDALRKQNEGLRGQHDRDSQELRNLCQARGDARRTVDRWKAQLASRNKELGALKHDIGEYVRISSELATENGRLREALAWCAGTLQMACGSAGKLRENDVVGLAGHSRTVASILDLADSVLEPAPPQGDGA